MMQTAPRETTFSLILLVSPQIPSVSKCTEDLRTCKFRLILILDATDMEHALAIIDMELKQTHCIVISKSGGTNEARNGILFTNAVFGKSEPHFERNPITANGLDSELYNRVVTGKWLNHQPPESIYMINSTKL